MHIGGLFKQDAFNTIVQEVNNDLKPDAIIISGDLTDDGLISISAGSYGDQQIQLS